MTTKKHARLFRVMILAVMCSLSFAVPTVQADYATVVLTDDTGALVPAVLARSNNYGYAVGWAGDFDPLYLIDCLITDLLKIQTLPNVRGIICTNLGAPESNTVYYEPDQIRVQGLTISKDDLIGMELPWDSHYYVADYLFLPMDINDDNVIVGNMLCLIEGYENEFKITCLPFVAEGPRGIPTLVFGIDDDDEITLMPVNNVLLSSAIATGINNSGDIVGGTGGLFDTGDYALMSQGFIFNKSDIEDDGLLDASEVKTVSCGGSILSFLLSINENGMMTGAYLSLKYPLANGSYLVDGDNNYLLSDEEEPIPAGKENIMMACGNLMTVKYFIMNGFVKSANSADNDYITIDNVSCQDILSNQTAGKVEFYATIPYTILDSGDILVASSSIDPYCGLDEELYTAAMSLDNESSPINISTPMSSYRCNAPFYDSVTPVFQDSAAPALADEVFTGDIDLSGTAIGAFRADDVFCSFVFAPCPLSAPGLNSPTGTIDQAIPEFCWETLADADYYYLIIQNQFQKTIFNTKYPAATVDNGDGTCVINPGRVLEPGEYYWFVRGENAYGIGADSEKMAFNVDTLQVKPSAPVLISPSGTIDQAIPEFCWETLADADYYYLIIQNQFQKTIFNKKYPAATVDNGDGTCAINPGKALAPGEYYWLARAENVYGLGPSSEKKQFIVE